MRHRNLKYIEYRDARRDAPGRLPPFLERELFDLDNDPLELNNLIGNSTNTNDDSFLRALHNKLSRMHECRGDDCRTLRWSALGDDVLEQ